MARLSGKAGKVWFDIDSGGTFGVDEFTLGVTKWSITDEADVLETTGMDDAGTAAYIGGVTRFSGSITCLWDDTADKVQPNDLAPGLLIKCKLEGVAAGQPAYSGDVVIKSVQPEVTVDGVVTYTLDVQGTGTLTRPA